MHKRLFFDSTQAVYWYYRHDNTIALYCYEHEANEDEKRIAHERMCPYDMTRGG
jgi:hypothetical protein